MATKRPKGTGKSRESRPKYRKKSRKSAKGAPKGTLKVTLGGPMVFKGRAEGAVCSTKSRARAARGAFFRKKGPARGSGRFVAPFRPFFGTNDPHDSMVFTVFRACPHFSGKVREKSGGGSQNNLKILPGGAQGNQKWRPRRPRGPFGGPKGAQIWPETRAELRAKKSTKKKELAVRSGCGPGTSVVRSRGVGRRNRAGPGRGGGRVNPSQT